MVVFATSKTGMAGHTYTYTPKDYVPCGRLVCLIAGLVRCGHELKRDVATGTQEADPCDAGEDEHATAPRGGGVVLAAVAMVVVVAGVVAMAMGTVPVVAGGRVCVLACHDGPRHPAAGACVVPTKTSSCIKPMALLSNLDSRRILHRAPECAGSK